MLPFPLRVVILVLVFAALAAWNYRADPHRWKEYVFVFVAGALGSLFGVLNDLLTSHLSPAYFVLGKGIPAGEGFLSRVVSLAIEAGFIAGAVGSCFVLYANNPHPLRPRLPYAALYNRYLVYPVVTAMSFGLLFSFGAQFLAPYPLARRLHPLVPVQDAAGFLSVWAIHLGIYVGLALGIVLIVLRIRRERCAQRPLVLFRGALRRKPWDCSIL